MSEPPWLRILMAALAAAVVVDGLWLIYDSGETAGRIGQLRIDMQDHKAQERDDRLIRLEKEVQELGADVKAIRR